MNPGPSDHPAAAYPSWLKAPAMPFNVIAGPPGNGARAFIDAAAGPDDAIIDLGAIITELSGLKAGDPATKAWIVAALTRRNEALAALGKLLPAIPCAWLISPSPQRWHREFWAERRAAVLLLDPGLDAALAGAQAEGVEARWVHAWYAEAGIALTTAPPVRPRAETPSRRPDAADRGYGPDHRKLRDRQLAREPWCRFCWEERRVKVPATVLDHIAPFRTPAGEFIGRNWGNPANHRSLCGPCHNSRGATRSRAEKPPGAGIDGKPLDPAHPWNRGS